jgi:ribosomal protein L44E
MSNRQLTPDELIGLYAPLMHEVHTRLHEMSQGDPELLWALRRKLAKELVYHERGKPMQRKALKAAKRKTQNGKCALCGENLPEKNTVLDRLKAMGGYTVENTRVICRECDWRVQQERGFA